VGGNADRSEAARKVMPGGVSSPVRAIDPYPPTIEAAEGPRIRDVEGTEYVDWCMAFGPLIHGHAPEGVTERLQDQLERGWNTGTNATPEQELAQRVVEWVPGIDSVRFVNSGTEATMSAVRLARAVQDADGIVKTPGAYHGAWDSVLVEAGSGVATHGVPGTDGVPDDAARHTYVVPFNDVEALEDLLAREADDVAAIILEPVMGNVGTIPPEAGYLEAVREVADHHDVLLIFDEVITGARLGKGGAQERYGVQPDLTCLGKIYGGGMPFGAYGGRRDLVEEVTPAGDVYQAGTASGNAVTMEAGLATLDRLEETGWADLRATGDAVRSGLEDLAEDHGLEATVQGLESMWTLFFTDGPVRDDAEAREADEDAFWTYHRAMMEQGVYLPPSPFESRFASTAHGDAEVQATLEAADEALGRASS
jgi:glutamate-1-semialdehyde 2,1-aminomutase